MVRAAAYVVVVVVVVVGFGVSPVGTTDQLQLISIANTNHHGQHISQYPYLVLELGFTQGRNILVNIVAIAIAFPFQISTNCARGYIREGI